MAQKKYKVDPKTKKRVIARPGRKTLTPEQRQASKARLQQNRATTVFLHMPHYRLGQTYGPGKVVVSATLAREFQFEEEKQREADTAFYGTKGVIVGPPRTIGNQSAHSTHQVPVETFDTTLDQDSSIAMTFKG